MNIEKVTKKYPIGAKVRYYPVKGNELYRQTKIRSEPWALGHGELVVKVEGETGGVSVNHISVDNGRPPPIPEATKKLYRTMHG